jgi:hypothetical protein
LGESGARRTTSTGCTTDGSRTPSTGCATDASRTTSTDRTTDASRTTSADRATDASRTTITDRAARERRTRVTARAGRALARGEHIDLQHGQQQLSRGTRRTDNERTGFTGPAPVARGGRVGTYPGATDAASPRAISSASRGHPGTGTLPAGSVRVATGGACYIGLVLEAR